MKKCRNKECGVIFNPVTTLQKYCFQCTVSKAKFRVKKEDSKKWNVQKKILKEKIKTLSDYKNDLQAEINKIARLIDYGHNCISCGGVPKKINGCHFHSVGSNPALRFNLLNIYLGCEHCNSFKGGNVHGYIDGLIREFGKEFYEYLKFELPQKYSILQLNKVEIKEKIKIAKDIVKVLNNDKEVLNNEQRIELRKIINEQIGIYG